jgi:hypothetical protein
VIKGTVEQIKYNKEGFCSYLSLDIEVLQKRKCIARFNFKGNCISTKLFERIRRNQVTDLRKLRFTPIFINNNNLILKSLDCKKYLSAELINISLEGMGIRIKEGTVGTNDNKFNIFLQHKNQIFVNGNYQKIWQKENDGQNFVGLRALNLDEDDFKNLQLIIKQDCIVDEKRAIY